MPCPARQLKPAAPTSASLRPSELDILPWALSTRPHAGWTKEAREARRTQLRDCLNGVVNKSGGDAHYYQGLHEVAAVLLFTCGAHAAPPLLERLMAVHLRDFTRCDQSETCCPAALLLRLTAQALGPAGWCYLGKVWPVDCGCHTRPLQHLLTACWALAGPPWMLCWSCSPSSCPSYSRQVPPCGKVALQQGHKACQLCAVPASAAAAAGAAVRSRTRIPTQHICSRCSRCCGG